MTLKFTAKHCISSNTPSYISYLRAVCNSPSWCRAHQPPRLPNVSYTTRVHSTDYTEGSFIVSCTIEHNLSTKHIIYTIINTYSLRPPAAASAACQTHEQHHAKPRWDRIHYTGRIHQCSRYYDCVTGFYTTSQIEDHAQFFSHESVTPRAAIRLHPWVRSCSIHLKQYAHFTT